MKNSPKMLERVTLEMSLKPFKSLEPDAIDAVCEEAIRQWLPLISLAKTASVLLWVADGSEILTWDGNLQTQIEWARYIGFANGNVFSHIQGDNDPRKAILYTDNPVRLRYCDLQLIIQSLKKIAADKFGVQMEVGATFDAGPEFAESAFKYKDHPEINRAEVGGKEIALRASYTVVCSWSKLNQDDAFYATYPHGIPDGTPFGEFLGRQCASFLPALGFDYIWFSNGFALSYFPWTHLGANYDGVTLPLADSGEMAKKVLLFWELFKAACPHYRTEIRGTNFGTGMDLAKDYIPLMELYRRKYVEFPPPNSPWGALNYDFGLEIAGYMSRMAMLPDRFYPFRFYANDPWFWQNPWWDLYDRQPYDIYCPLSAARINENGELEPPRIIEILTIDTEKGELNEEGPLEIIPHIRRALNDFPDAPGLLTWVYPFRELHEDVAASNAASGTAFFHDWFVRNAINEGLPLNTVINTDDLACVLATQREKLDSTILFTSTCWLRGDRVDLIDEYAQSGGKVLLYGPVTDPRLQQLLNIRAVHGLDGDLDLSIDNPAGTNVDVASRIHHISMISNGPICEQIADTTDRYTTVWATVRQKQEERIFALSRSMPQWNGGRIAWVRGSLPFVLAGVTSLPIRQEPEWLDSSVFTRYLLQDFDYTITRSKHPSSTIAPLLFVGRHDNAFIFTGCKRDTSTQLQFRFPDGVPLLTGQTIIAGEGVAEYALDRTFHEECRVFVNQKESSLVSCYNDHPFPTTKKRTKRMLTITNLINATVTVYPPLHAVEQDLIEVKQGDDFLNVTDKICGNKLVLEGISNTIHFSW